MVQGLQAGLVSQFLALERHLGRPLDARIKIGYSRMAGVCHREGICAFARIGAAFQYATTRSESLHAHPFHSRSDSDFSRLC